MKKLLFIIAFILLSVQTSSAEMGFRNMGFQGMNFEDMDFGFNIEPDCDFYHPLANKKIFIIGASTVRYDYDDKREGWGTALCKYNMVKPENGFNEARRGATAENYKTINDVIRRTKGEAYWGKTKQLMEDEVDFRGGYLLIQFGGNDNIQHVSKETFMKELKVYIDEAKKLDVTPVLISPINSRFLINGELINTRGLFPEYVEELANRENVIFLDLHKKSMEEFSKLTEEELAEKFGAIPYPNGRIDNTHFTPEGAKIVANWVQELACEEDTMLCQQFKD